MGRLREAVENLHMSISLSGNRDCSEATQELDTIEGLLRAQNAADNEQEEEEQEEEQCSGECEDDEDADDRFLSNLDASFYS